MNNENKVKIKRMPPKTWTKEACAKEALLYQTRSDFMRKSKSAYTIAHRKGFLNEICIHMIPGRVTLRKWTKESCSKIAAKFDNRSAFQCAYSGAYRSARQNGWLNEITKHMKPKQKARGYWTLERCMEVAKKCTTKKEFRKRFPAAISAAEKKGFMKKICGHMTEERKPPGYWTKDRVKKEALKFKIRGDFRDGSATAYGIAVNDGYLDEICGHMDIGNRPPGYWTKDRCHQEAKKYHTRIEFRKNAPGAYKASFRNSWLEEICKHMDIIGHKYRRFIYSIQFADNSVYVGLTYNPRERIAKHLKDSHNKAVKNNMTMGIQHKLVIDSKPYNINEAQKVESKKIESYRKRGWIILNQAKTGHGSSSLGSSERKWTPEIVTQEAKKYSSLKEFEQKSPGACCAAYKLHIMPIVGAHFIRAEKPKGYWKSKENCRAEALNHMTITSFQKSASAAYQNARKMGILDDITGHMLKQKPKGYWTKSNCGIEAQKYKTKSEFAEGAPVAYATAQRRGWLEEICQHMKSSKKPHGYWSKEVCQAESLKYSTRSEFQKGSPGVYSTAQRRGWIDKICAHMGPKRKPRGFWTKFNCSIEAKAFSTMVELKKHSRGAFNAIQQNGWAKELCAHMC